MEKQVYSFADGRFLPDRYIEGTCPNCGYERARGDQCENCTKQLDPTDLINPRSAISGSTDLEVRETKHLYLRQSALREELRAWIDEQDRLADPVDLDREQVARRRRGPAGPRHHPRPRLGHPGDARDRALAGHGGQGLLRLVRRADRIHRRHGRMGACERPGRGRLAALVAHRRGRGGRALRAVHGQGQRALPHPELPGDDPRVGRAVEARRLHQVLQLPQLRRRQVLDQPGARRVHGRGAGDPALATTGAGG